MVFISDGAIWTRKWEENAFPNAISILNYFHAIEYLHGFIDSNFKEKKEGEKWAESKGLLLDSNVQQVIKNIKKLAPGNHVAKNLIPTMKPTLAGWFINIISKLNVESLVQEQFESAHRTVVQKE